MELGLNDLRKVAIVIPAFNEEYSIAVVVKSVLHLGTVFVVDDASEDDTALMAESVGAVVIRRKINQGYEAAIDLGFKFAHDNGALYVVTMDADGQHSSDCVAKLIDELLAGYQLALGVRSNFPRVSEKIFAFCTRLFWGVKDPLCGLKGYSIGLYKKYGYFDTGKCIGAELAIKSIRDEVAVIQIPVLIKPRLGVSRFGSVISANFKILKGMCNLLYVL